MAGPTPICIIEWNPEWPRKYSAEVARIRACTKSLDFHHIGSTSVPGCAAKPVIDIMGVVDSFEIYEPDRRTLVNDLGYESLGEYGIPGRDFLFRYDGDYYHMSVFESGDQNIGNNLKIRDRLTTDASLRARYVSLKRALAETHPDDYSVYNGRKSVLIAEILAS